MVLNVVLNTTSGSLPRIAFAMMLVMSLVFSAACSTQQDDADGNSPGTMRSVDTSGSMMTETPMASMQDNLTPEQQKQRAKIQVLLQQANRQVTKGELRDAKATYAEVLVLDSGNLMVKNRIAEIDHALGLGGGDALMQSAAQVKLMRQRQQAEVNDRFSKATRLYSLGEYKDAETELKVADTLMRYDPYNTNFGDKKRDVADLLDQSHRRIEETESAREAQAIEDSYNELRREENLDQERRIAKVRNLMERGFQAFEDQDFDRAEDFAKQVLYEAPTFAKAKDLRDFSRQARHAAWRKTWYKRRREQLQDWKRQMRETQIPWHHILQFPERDVWDQITKLRKNKGRSADVRDDSEAVTALKNRLANERVTFDFSDMTVGEAIDNIRDTQNVNIVLSKAARDEKGDEPAELTVRDHNFGDSLSTMLEDKELAYVFKYDMIFVVGKTESTGAVYPEVYEVRDLTVQLPNFVAPDLTLRPGPAGEEGAAAVFGTEGDSVRDTEPELLLELVRDNVGVGTWEIEDRDLQLGSGQLVAVTTPDVHREIEAFLDDLRQFTKIAVHVETRFISIREGRLNEIGLDIRGTGGSAPGNIALLDDVTNGQDDNASVGNDNSGPGLPAGASQSPGAGAFFNNNGETDFRARTENIFNRALGGFLSSTGGASVGFAFLDDLELNTVFTAVEKSAFANVLRAPSLTIYNNQRANLTLVNQVTYVKDYDVEVAQTAFIADPLVDIIQDGLVLDVRPTVSHDRRYVTLELRPTVAVLGRPIQTFVTPLAGLTTSVTIELPELQYRSASTTVKVPDRGHVVIGGLKNITTVDRRSETPILSQIPILSFFFSKKGRSDELSDLLIILSVEIVDLEEAENNLSR
ncbi:MAG: hypothetical protein V3W41_01420 [Planctomycetota bacterium]